MKKMRALLTGYPGFLATPFVEGLLASHPDLELSLLVQGSYTRLARERLGELPEASRQRATVIEGDLTVQGLAPVLANAQDFAHIFHFAAAYDLTVGTEVAERVNQLGTKNILEFSLKQQDLERFHHISTCYVSGKRETKFGEHDLPDASLEFNNEYERTKCLAEIEARRTASEQGLPLTVYRPAIVLGDSTTGMTQKYDGLYFVIRWILKQPGIAVLPTVMGSDRFEVNVVPRDFVIASLLALWSLSETKGETFHLSDPKPLRVPELLSLIEKATQKKIIRLPLPLFAAKGALKFVPGVERLMEIPPQAIDYFVHPTRYTCTRTREVLHRLGVHCPPLKTYMANLVEFVRQNPSISSDPMI
jgi:nucleoside-diphosphate-sugar epimerase